MDDGKIEEREEHKKKSKNKRKKAKKLKKKKKKKKRKMMMMEMRKGGIGDAREASGRWVAVCDSRRSQVFRTTGDDSPSIAEKKFLFRIQNMQRKLIELRQEKARILSIRAVRRLRRAAPKEAERKTWWCQPTAGDAHVRQRTENITSASSGACSCSHGAQ